MSNSEAVQLHTSTSSLELEHESLLPLRTTGTTPAIKRVSLPDDGSQPITLQHPWWPWPLCLAAVLAVSTAGVVFLSMEEVPPLTLAAWRLQLTSLLLTIGAVGQYLQGVDSKEALPTTLALLAASGTSLAFHFGLWVFSLKTTSLEHSLVLVSSTPVWVALGTWVTRRPISSGEMGGAMLGLLGTIVLSLGVKSEREVTFHGDLAAVAGKEFALLYIYCF